jgi:CPA1 family monovalent cation:H+ antiporter
VSTLLGLAIGYVSYMVMKLYSDKRGELFTFIVEAYGAYVLAEHWHVSGILTLIVAVVATKGWIDADLEAKTKKKQKSFLRRLRLGGILTTTQERLEYIYEMAKEFGYIAAVVIFFALAEMVDVHKLWEYRVEIVTMFLATTLIRAVMMAKFALLGAKTETIKPVGTEGWFILTFSGMKGALSIILVHMIPDTFEYKELFESVTIGVVVLSIFVYGTVLWSYFTFFRAKKEPKLFTHAS